MHNCFWHSWAQLLPWIPRGNEKWHFVMSKVVSLEFGYTNWRSECSFELCMWVIAIISTTSFSVLIFQRHEPDFAARVCENRFSDSFQAKSTVEETLQKGAVGDDKRSGIRSVIVLSQDKSEMRNTFHSESWLNLFIISHTVLCQIVWNMKQEWRQWMLNINKTVTTSIGLMTGVKRKFYASVGMLNELRSKAAFLCFIDRKKNRLFSFTVSDRSSDAFTYCQGVLTDWNVWLLM